MKPPENHQSHHLEECLRLLTLLSDCVTSARSFRGRWAAVSATLNRLRAAVNEIARLPRNDFSDELLRLLSQTLTVMLSLSDQCRLAEPPAGRLRTQSDLAAAASSLNQQADDADFLVRTGDLLPAPCSSRLEALRAEARTLVIRLQIGTLESRIPALDSLIAMFQGGGDKKLTIAVEQGLVPALIRLLDCASLSHSEARDKAVAIVSRISAVDSCRHLLVADGDLLVSHLSRVLVEPDGGGSSKENVCAALQVLTLEKDIAMTVGSGPTISIILETCRSGTPPAQTAAAGVLNNLSALPELRQNLVEEDCIPVLIRILQSGTVSAKEKAASCLSNLAAEDANQGIKLAIFQEGVLDCIRNYWEGSAADSLRDFQPAIRLLRNLSSSSFFAEIILSAGFLSLMILALDSSLAGTRTEAARAVSDLATACTKPGREGVEHAVPLLVRMLEAKGADEKEAAVKALASLMPFKACRKLMRKNEKGILSVIMLLDPLVCNVPKKHSVSVLLAVAQTRRCRNLAVASGARGFLPLLQSTQVEGAKELSELLSKGKLLGVFPRS